MCVSAYLKAARVLALDGTRHFALRSLDRLLADGWSAEGKSTAADKSVRPTLKHVIAYSDPKPTSAKPPACSTTTLAL